MTHIKSNVKTMDHILPERERTQRIREFTHSRLDRSLSIESSVSVERTLPLNEPKPESSLDVKALQRLSRKDEDFLLA